MKLVRTLSLIIALAGASTVHADTPPAKAPARPELSKGEVAKAEAFVDDFHKASTQNKDACPKMGPALKVVFDKHLDWMKKMAESGKEMPKADRDRLRKKQEEAVVAVFKCKDDQGVIAEMQRFKEVLMKKKDAKSEPPPAKK
jgi:hypothetical protein